MAAASQQDTGGKVRLGGDHTGGALGMMRGSSARGQGRRCLLGRSVTFQWTAGLDMARGGFETGGAFVEMTVDANVS